MIPSNSKLINSKFKSIIDHSCRHSFRLLGLGLISQREEYDYSIMSKAPGCFKSKFVFPSEIQRWIDWSRVSHRFGQFSGAEESIRWKGWKDCCFCLPNGQRFQGKTQNWRKTQNWPLVRDLAQPFGDCNSLRHSSTLWNIVERTVRERERLKRVKQGQTKECRAQPINILSSTLLTFFNHEQSLQISIKSIMIL